MEQLSTEECDRLIVETFENRGGIELLRSMLAHTPMTEKGEEPEHPEDTNNQPLPWCKWGRRRPMPTPCENVCCKQRPCITTVDIVTTNIPNTDVLSIAIVGRSDDFADTPEYSPASYRKAAYRQWIMWQHGYLGWHNRRVIPSCVVWAVQNAYPAPDGVYLGFKEY